MTVILGQDDEWLPKWPLYQNDRSFVQNDHYFSFLNNGHFWHTKMTINSKKLWANHNSKIDRYFKPKWPLFQPKLSLYVGWKLTFILVETTVQNDRYLYQNEHDICERTWRSFWGYSNVGDIVLLVTIFRFFDETSMLATC